MAVELTTKAPKSGKSYTGTIDFEKIWEETPEDVKKAKFDQSVRVDVQSKVRTILEKEGLSQEEQDKQCAEVFATYKPSVGPQRKSKVERNLSDFEDMTPEDQEAFIKKLRERRKSKDS